MAATTNITMLSMVLTMNNSDSRTEWLNTVQITGSSFTITRPTSTLVVVATSVPAIFAKN